MPQVMPFNIKILCQHYSNQKMFDENQNVLVDIRQPGKGNNPTMPREMPRKSIELTDALYCEILSLSDADDISAFCARYPDIRFLYKEQKLVRAYGEFLSEKAYYREIKRQIDFFKDYMFQYAQIQNIDSLSDKEMLELYIVCCRMEGEFRQNISNREHRLHRLFEAAVRECGLTDHLYDIEPVIDKHSLIGISGRIPDQDKDIIIRQYQKLFVQDCKEEFISILLDVTEDNLTVFDANAGIINYECPTVLSALYAMLVVSSFNADIYKMCAHDGCHNYFKVDKTHPQTRCPEHMVSRQTRRNNAAARKVRGNKESLVKQKERQALAISNAEVAYQKTGDIEAFIKFWEELWASRMGLMSQNNDDAFKLADLYDEVGRYEDALKFVRKIGKEKCFSERAKEYEEAFLIRIQRQKQKAEMAE